MTEVEFKPFLKMGRLSRECIITEKLDGTNAQILITEDGQFLTGSRTRWITPQNDNAGFAAWAHAHKDELMQLGVGRHFGEWWGRGIQRGYNRSEKTFSLFNTTRWGVTESPPACVSVVPVIYHGMFTTDAVESALEELKVSGSRAAPGFMDPEGIVCFHTAANIAFKKTIHGDEVPKSLLRPAVSIRG